MATIFSIRADTLALADLLRDMGGDITEADAEAALDEWLREIGADTRKKADAYGALIREFEAREEARRTEAARLVALADSDRRAREKMKERLLWFMQEIGERKLETERFRFSISKNGGALPVRLLCDPAELPEDLRTTIVTHRAATDAIRTRLEAGEALPFAELGERGEHLRIK